jgi:aspartyl-tRNA(Asn)/glutamyl-tRNA(Gln) amidotransferase subunit C
MESYVAIDEQTVAKIARLARLDIPQGERAHYARELSGILTFVEQLREVKTDGVPQMTSVAELQLPWREDRITDGNKQEEVLKNAPASEHGCFVVPKVVE